MQSNSYASSDLRAAAPALSPELDDERQQTRLGAALFGFAAIVQLIGMQSTGVRQMISQHGLRAALPHLAIGLPASALAIGLWYGRRLRIATITFALLWTTFSVWAVVEVARLIGEAQAAPSGTTAGLSRWFVPMVVTRSICFLAATIVLGTGRPRKPRLVAGTVLGVVFGMLFIAEYVFQQGAAAPAG